MIKEITDFKDEIVFETSKPDGTPQKLLDVSKLTNLGWQAQIDLKQGINSVYAFILFDKYVDFIDVYAEINEQEQENLYYEIIQHILPLWNGH